MPIQVSSKLKKKRDEFTATEEASREEKLTEVPDEAELLRILTMARREVPDPESPEAEQLAAFMTGKLAKLPIAQLYPGPLMATQALALREGKVCKGGFFPIVVGGGKMLTCYLMAALYLAAGYTRIIYVIPGDMRKTVKREFKKYRQCWHGPTELQLRVVSYEEISNEANAEELDDHGRVTKPSLLDKLQPQVVIFDEVHNTSNTGAAVTKRMNHRMRRAPDTICLAFTGTPFNEGIQDAAHILDWCLKENSPLPRPSVRGTYKTLQAWGGYLNAKEGFGRVELGALARYGELYDEDLDVYNADADYQNEMMHRVRRLVARRILETPGVIGTRDAPLDVPLTIEPLYPRLDCADTAVAYAAMMNEGVLPDGTEQPDDISVARHLSTMGYNFWSKWVPDPPQEWKLDRNGWNKWCRRALKYNKHRLTSEKTVKNAIKKGLYKEVGLPTLQRWENSARLYFETTGNKEPPSQPQWLGDGAEVVDACRHWLSKYGDRGLIWVKHIGLGELLSKELGIPYYGAGGGKNSKTGVLIMDHPGGPAIASIDACGTGKNLQYLFSDNLWLCIPGEQSLARTHRMGQPAKVVRNFIYLGCYQHLAAFERARDVKATFAEDMTLSPQKLKYAHTVMPSAGELRQRGGARWEQRF
ncbi:MAG: hypothetical protein RLZZ450_111 [Pseudomonadota bacterium]